MAWAEGLPPASPVARALAAAEEEVRAKLDALQARDSARETELDALRDLVVAVRSLFERERLEREEDLLVAQRGYLAAVLGWVAWGRGSAPAGWRPSWGNGASRPDPASQGA